MRDRLYPPIEPYVSAMLKLDATHSMYWEQSGNPEGIPVLFLHGGPGAGATSVHRRFFDPSFYRIVIFDQRGAGRSIPHGNLSDNTTAHLIEDIERLRNLLGISKFLLFGGSWGSTLALAYAQTHPHRVSELLLRGIFTLRERELSWFYQKGTDALFPDLFEEYVSVIPEDERDDLISAFYKRLTGDDETEKLACARAWSTWEGSTLSLLADPDREQKFGDPAFAVAFARIECHYFMNGGWLKPRDQLIRAAGGLSHIPGVIAQGRYDVVTPMMTAYDLYKNWPDAELHIVDDAGHTGTEPGIVDVLVRAAERFAKR